jgi:transposase
MARRPRMTASGAQVAELRELSRSPRRDEADRARAILLSLEGWTSEAIGTAFGVTADSVRHWRNWYATGGVEALRAAVVPGPSGERGLQALSIAAAILAEPVQNRSNWTLPRLQAEIERRGGPPLSTSRLSLLLREKGGSAGGGPGTR